jgi:hypothetical protein
MGHAVNPDLEYRLLQRRLGRVISLGLQNPPFMKILRLLWSPEEAQIARRS